MGRRDRGNGDRPGVHLLRELDGDPILLATVGAGQFLGEMGVVENRPRTATARAASEVEVEILTPTEFLDQIARSPQAARELIQRLSQRLRQADDRIVNDERRSNRAQKPQTDADGKPVAAPFDPNRPPNATGQGTPPAEVKDAKDKEEDKKKNPLKKIFGIFGGKKKDSDKPKPNNPENTDKPSKPE